MWYSKSFRRDLLNPPEVVGESKNAQASLSGLVSADWCLFEDNRLKNVLLWTGPCDEDLIVHASLRGNRQKINATEMWRAAYGDRVQGPTRRWLFQIAMLGKSIAGLPGFNRSIEYFSFCRREGRLEVQVVPQDSHMMTSTVVQKKPRRHRCSKDKTKQPNHQSC